MIPPEFMKTYIYVFLIIQKNFGILQEVIGS